MADRIHLRIICSRQHSASQGHDLLAYYLGRSSWKVSGWQGTLGQRLIARMLRWLPRHQRRRPALVYHLALANWYSRFGFVHLIWGDYLIEFIDRPERCILTLHQPYESWSEGHWERIGRCAGVVCMAERECLKIRQRYPSLPCVFIPHGVDTSFWRNLPLPPKRQICAVGRHLRNFEMLVRVARLLLDRHPDLSFFWVVNPDFKIPPSLVSMLPTERFTVLRNLSAEDLHRLYVESWLFCTPYDNVAASNAIVESMASGTPVFTTRVGGMSSYGDTGVITMVDNNDDAAMVEAVTHCLGSPELRAKLSANGREHALQNFRWSEVVEAHEAFYRLVGEVRTDAAQVRKPAKTANSPRPFVPSRD